MLQIGNKLVISIRTVGNEAGVIIQFGDITSGACHCSAAPIIAC